MAISGSHNQIVTLWPKISIGRPQQTLKWMATLHVSLFTSNKYSNGHTDMQDDNNERLFAKTNVSLAHHLKARENVHDIDE